MLQGRDTLTSALPVLSALKAQLDDSPYPESVQMDIDRFGQLVPLYYSSERISEQRRMQLCSSRLVQ